MPETPTPNGRNWSWPAWEKHLTIILVAVTMAVGWRIFDTTERTSDKVIELGAEMNSLKTNLSDFKDDVRASINQRFMDQDRRINENRQRIERLENVKPQ